MPFSVTTSRYASYLTTKPETFSMMARMGWMLPCASSMTILISAPVTRRRQKRLPWRSMKPARAVWTSSKSRRRE